MMDDYTCTGTCLMLLDDEVKTIPETTHEPTSR
jgi:hypothetical protein